jgi:hypothetical protein
LSYGTANENQPTSGNKKTKRRPRSPLQLKLLSKRVLQSKACHKLVLKCAYARHIFKNKLKEWQSTFPLQCPVEVCGLGKTIDFWFSYPKKKIKSTGSLLAKSIDCSPNLTHLLVRTSTTGICGVSADAWRKCAKSNETILKRPLVEDLLDKQSVPNTRTHFSEEVEK